ncbi:MAG TPA: VCBS repeat-containing protein [Planctomycetaceae bacterium]
MKHFIRRRFQHGPFVPIAAIGLTVLLVIGVCGLALRPAADRPQSATVEPSEPARSIDEVGPQVTAFCGDCHGTPSPAGFPKEAWHAEVKKGYDFYFDSERTDLSPPDFDRVVAWFRTQAPDEVVVPLPAESATTGKTSDKLRFRVSGVAAGRDDEPPPAVSFVTWCELSAADRPGLLWCDMRSGAVLNASPARSTPQLLYQAGHPAHAELCDLDADGLTDLVVADLGSFSPSDHAEGKVVWLQRTADAAWRPVVIQAGLGRVADVQPGDFDGDGDIDLVVAEFGWRKTGRILLLENLGNKPGDKGMPPEFRMRVLDSRHGTIHVPVADLDGDGRLDFVALISQEHETVVAFLNDGQGGFRKETLFAANEPTFGSSGIQLVDLDLDGDFDVLYTNGDTFDSFYLKPFHSIRWLENRGTYPFADHFLAAMPGVHRALACDLDGDGDLDIAACSLLPDQLFGRQKSSGYDSLLWLEQTAPGTFARHSLEQGTYEHAALAAGDFDGDGDIDLAVGRFAEQAGLPPIAVWWNLRIDAGHAVDHAAP